MDSSFQLLSIDGTDEFDELLRRRTDIQLPLLNEDGWDNSGWDNRSFLDISYRLEGRVGDGDDDDDDDDDGDDPLLFGAAP